MFRERTFVAFVEGVYHWRCKPLVELQSDRHLSVRGPLHQIVLIKTAVLSWLKLIFLYFSGGQSSFPQVCQLEIFPNLD